MFNEEQLLESKELRNQLADRVEVLEKVKDLLLLPDIKMATTKQVSDFYEVSERWIKELLETNREELVNDGYRVWKAEDFNSEEKFPIKNVVVSKGKFTIKFSNNQIETYSPRGVALFPKRAILRIGMLLRNSKMATEVRNQLLNIEEKTTNETKIQDIDQEQKLAIEIGMSYMSGNIEQFAKSSMALIDFKNRHINKLKQDNKALAGQILKWEDRSKINFAVRKLSKMLHKPEGYTWNDLYKELQYKHHINVKLRGDKPYIQHIKENEWDKVIQSFSALCESNNISPSDIFKDVMTEVEVNA
jgi:hypothetical protein